MIRYICPTCKSQLESPDAEAGVKGACVHCGQRLQVPPVPAPSLLHDPHWLSRRSVPIACMAICALAAVAGVLITVQALKSEPANPVGIAFAVNIPTFFVMAIALVVSYLSLSANRCPACKWLGSAVIVGQEEVSRDKAVGLVTRRSHASGWIWNTKHWATAGGTHTYQERAPIIRITYHLICRCVRCGHSWTRRRTHEQEDFSR